MWMNAWLGLLHVTQMLTVLTLWEAIAAPVDMGMKGMDLIIVQVRKSKACWDMQTKGVFQLN